MLMMMMIIILPIKVARHAESEIKEEGQSLGLGCRSWLINTRKSGNCSVVAPITAS